MNAEQARMARALTGKSVREIAELADVNPNTVSRIENGGDPKVSTVMRMRLVYMNLGVQFLNTGDPASSPSVCLKAPSGEDDERRLFND